MGLQEGRGPRIDKTSAAKSLIGKFFLITTFCIAIYQSNLSTDRTNIGTVVNEHHRKLNHLQSLTSPTIKKKKRIPKGYFGLFSVWDDALLRCSFLSPQVFDICNSPQQPMISI